MLHTSRQIVDNDEKWRGILRGLNATFHHQTVMGKQVEDYISEQAGIDLTRVYDQYLRDVRIPVLEYRVANGSLQYRWSNVVSGFDMPVEVTLAKDRYSVIRPTERWQSVKIDLASPADFKVDVNYYVTSKEVPPGS